MNVLLINSNRFKKPWPVLPLGLCMVAAAVENAGHNVKVQDLCFSKNVTGDIATALETFKPGVIGIGIRNIDNCVGHNPLFLLDEQKEVIDYCKREFKGPIILGGSGVSINSQEVLEYLDMPYSSCGDGEKVMVEFIDRIANSQPLKGVNGLVIRENGKITQEAAYVFNEDVNHFVLPNPKKYLDLDLYDKYDASLQIQTKRGCALKCSYCPNKYIEGDQYRLFDPKRIADHIETLVKETGFRRFEFVDSTLNLPLSHAKQVLKEIIAKKLDITLNALGLNPVGLDEEFVDLMKKSGFQVASLNIDAGCNITLKDMQKNFNVKDIVRVAGLIRKKNIPVAWYLLMGAPRESYQTLHESLEFVRKIASPWDGIFIAVGFRVYKGAPLADRMISKDPNCTKDNFLTPVVVHPPKIDIEAVKVLTKRFAIDQPNIIIYNDEHTPEFVIKMGFKLIKKRFPDLPIWRIRIFSQYINKVTGLLLMKKVFYSIIKHKTIKAAKRQVSVN